MKVQALLEFTPPGETAPRREGEIWVVPDAVARTWIERGLVKERLESGIRETKVDEPPETAEEDEPEENR